MRGGTSDDARKDQILLSYSRRIARTKTRGGGDSPGDLLADWIQSTAERAGTRRRRAWQNVLWVFLRVVLHVRSVKRPSRWSESHQRYCPRPYEGIASGGITRNAHGPRRPASWPAAMTTSTMSGSIFAWRRGGEERPGKLLNAGLIEEDGFLLIVGTRVYGKSMADYARDGPRLRTGPQCRLRAVSVLTTRRPGAMVSPGPRAFTPLPGGGRQAQGGESA